MDTTDLNDLNSTDQKIIAAALLRLELLRKQEAFDPIHLDSKPTPRQQEVIDDFGKVSQQWIRAGNQSGKSQTCAFLLCAMMSERHPIVAQRRNDPDPRKGWGQEPLLAIVAGRTGKQIEDSLLPKIRSYLEPGTYKEVRVGNIIQRLELTNGNRIIFQSLENPTVARERLMSYVAFVTWVDELPPTLDLVREILVRTQARNGYALFSFTPTVVNMEIQKFVDNLSGPGAKVYRFHMLDNPLYSDPERRAEILARYAHLPEHIQKAIFEGEWMSAEGQVYYFDYSSMVEMPVGYSPMWRHIESVDPAISSATGVTLWAEDPNTGVWYCILAQYVKDIQVPSEIVSTVKKLVHGRNIIRRTSDYAPWYVNTANKDGDIKPKYSTVNSKNDGRKPELIKQFQEFLGKRIRIAPHCTDLIDEITECRWSDRAEAKIVNHSSYHLIDSAQYFSDIIPKREEKIQYTSHDDYLYQANEKRKMEKARAETRKQMMLVRRNRWKR